MTCRRAQVRPRAAFGAGLLLLATAAQGNAAPPAKPGERIMIFRLAGASFAIPLPDHARMARAPDHVAFDLARGGRRERWLDIRAPGTGPATFDRQRTLPNGRLDFSISDNIGGGSGGPIAELSGRIRIGAHSLDIACSDQGEQSRQPDWCLPYLERLEVAHRSRGR